jgi:hypothetical protein
MVDPTWSTTRLILLSIVESEVYLTAACLLSFRPLLMWIWARAHNNTQLTELETLKTSKSYQYGRHSSLEDNSQRV